MQHLFEAIETQLKLPFNISGAYLEALRKRLEDEPHTEEDAPIVQHYLSRIDLHKAEHGKPVIRG